MLATGTSLNGVGHNTEHLTNLTSALLPRAPQSLYGIPWRGDASLTEFVHGDEQNQKTMKKSNNPQKAKELRAKSKGGGRGIHVRLLKIKPRTHYEQVMTRALWAYVEQGREAAIAVLQAERPWLIQYCVAKTDLPSSGEILDGLVANIQRPLTHKLFKTKQ